MEKIYTTRTLAQLLQVSSSTIRREIDEGRIACFKVRGQLRFRESDIQKYLNQLHSRNAQSEKAEIYYPVFKI